LEFKCQVHHYKEPFIANASVGVAAPVSDDVFHSTVHKCPREFLGITGYDASPKWYSPTGNTWPVQFADLSFIDFAEQRGLRKIVANNWLGELFKVRHHMLVRCS
jgi:hypothetical protein